MSFEEAEKAVNEWLRKNPKFRLILSDDSEKRFYFEMAKSSSSSQQFYVDFPASSKRSWEIATEGDCDEFLGQAKKLCLTNPDLSVEELLSCVGSSELSSGVPVTYGGAVDDIKEWLRNNTKFKLIFSDDTEEILYFEVAMSSSSSQQFYITFPALDYGNLEIATKGDCDDFLKEAKKLCLTKPNLSVEELLSCVGSSELSSGFPKEDYDVVFHFPKPDGTYTTISGRKSLVAAKSCVFDRMFSIGLQECQGPIAQVYIDDIDENTFQDFLSYAEQDILPVDPYAAAHLVYVAEKYMVPNLANKCLDVLLAKLSTENVIRFMELSFEIVSDDMRTRCLDYISAHAEEVLTGPDVIFTNRHVIQSIIELESLPVRDIVLYNMAVDWAKYVVDHDNTDEEPSDEDIRFVLGDMIYLLHLPALSVEEFAQVCESGILSDSEKLMIYKYIITRAVDQDLKWPIKPRVSVEFCLERTGVSVPCAYTPRSVDALNFVAESDITLTGVGLYPGCSIIGYFVRVEIRHLEHLLFCKTDTVPFSGNSTPYRIGLDEPVSISAGKLYTIKATAYNTIGYSAAHCIDRCTQGKVIISFYKYDRSLSTNPTKGQIPQLFFRLN